MTQAILIQAHELEGLIEQAVTKAIATHTGVAMPQDRTAQAHNSDLLTAKEACKFLHISRPTLIALHKKGAITFYPIANRHLFSKSELETYVKTKPTA